MDSTTLPARLAAQYVRMSTDHQRYSIEIQTRAIADYAALNGFKVIRTYEDRGRSGLNIEGRAGLTRLLHDIQAGSADFTAILVFDVSRWGRFQDLDESAHYEYLCRRAGVDVFYCSEPFYNDLSLSTSIMKLIKRAMAGEYSRELSSKTFAAHVRGALNGYHQGGRANFGLRRCLLDENGNVVLTLKAGQRKALAGGNVILVPGSRQEVAIVKRIFYLFVDERYSVQRISNVLNSEFSRSSPLSNWNTFRVRNILRNEQYTGRTVYGRTSSRLKTKRTSVPRDLWTTGPSPCTSIIDRETFDKAARFLSSSRQVYSDQFMLSGLKALAVRNGFITNNLIAAAPEVASPATYVKRFGSVTRACLLANCPPPRRRGLPPRQEPRVPSIATLVGDSCKRLERLFGTAGLHSRMHVVSPSSTVVVGVVCATSFLSPNGKMHWRCMLGSGPNKAGVERLAA